MNDRTSSRSILARKIKEGKFRHPYEMKKCGGGPIQIVHDANASHPKGGKVIFEFLVFNKNFLRWQQSKTLD